MSKKETILDCQDMPKEIKTIFFEQHESTGNDCYVEHYWNENDLEEDYEEEGDYSEDIKDFIPSRTKLDNWILAQKGVDKGSKVIVKHWW